MAVISCNENSLVAPCESPSCHELSNTFLVTLLSNIQDLMILLLPLNIDAQDLIKEIFAETF